MLGGGGGEEKIYIVHVHETPFEMYVPELIRIVVRMPTDGDGGKMSTFWFRSS